MFRHRALENCTVLSERAGCLAANRDGAFIQGSLDETGGIVGGRIGRDLTQGTAPLAASMQAPVALNRTAEVRCLASTLLLPLFNVRERLTSVLVSG